MFPDKKLALSLLFGALLAAPFTAYGHHAFAEYDADKPVTLNGKLISGA